MESIYEAGTRVPFIVTWPGKIKPGTSKALMSHIDLFASMASLVKEEIPSGAAGDSENQLAAMLGKDKKGRKYVIESSGVLAVTTGDWKYIMPHQKKTKKSSNNNIKQQGQLYHLKKDISEKENVVAKYPKKVQKLRAIIEQEVNKK